MDDHDVIVAQHVPLSSPLSVSVTETCRHVLILSLYRRGKKRLPKKKKKKKKTSFGFFFFFNKFSWIYTFFLDFFVKTYILPCTVWHPYIYAYNVLFNRHAGAYERSRVWNERPATHDSASYNYDEVLARIIQYWSEPFIYLEIYVRISVLSGWECVLRIFVFDNADMLVPRHDELYDYPPKWQSKHTWCTL